MHSPQARQVVQTPLANVSRMGSSRAFDCIKAFARLLDRRARAAEGVISNYGGLGWCDSTEQQLISGIAVCHRTVA
jgi:hypothetical protein